MKRKCKDHINPKEMMNKLGLDKPNSFLDSVICFFRGHKWDNIGNYEPPAGGDGVTTCYSSLHKCERCGKEEMKGMGCITW